MTKQSNPGPSPLMGVVHPAPGASLDLVGRRHGKSVWGKAVLEQAKAAGCEVAEVERGIWSIRMPGASPPEPPIGPVVVDELLGFVEKLAEDWTRDGTSGDHPGVSRAAFELLERLYPEKPVKKYVLARSRQHFVNWCDERGINPLDRVRVAFVDDPARLAGIAGPKRGGRCEIIITRGSGHHPRFADILEAAGLAGF